MSVSNNKITAPIELKEVADLLGSPINYDTGSVCSHNNINPIAKHKPIRNSKIGILTEEDKANANYGTILPIITITSGKLNTPNLWTYEQPRGGNYNEPYRLTDFNNYYHIKSACFGIGWNTTDVNISENFNPINWQNDNYMFMYITFYNSEIQGYSFDNVTLKDVLHDGNSTNMTGEDADDFFIWVMIQYNNNIYLKRTQYSVGYYLSSQTQSQNSRCFVEFNIKTHNESTPNHPDFTTKTADFNGALRDIRGNYKMFAFLAHGNGNSFTSWTGTAIDDSVLTGILSLECIVGASTPTGSSGGIVSYTPSTYHIEVIPPTYSISNRKATFTTPMTICIKDQNGNKQNNFNYSIKCTPYGGNGFQIKFGTTIKNNTEVYTIVNSSTTGDSVSVNFPSMENVTSVSGVVVIEVLANNYNYNMTINVG